MGLICGDADGLALVNMFFSEIHATQTDGIKAISISYPYFMGM